MSSSFLATLYGQISSNLLERDANYEIESRNFGLVWEITENLDSGKTFTVSDYQALKYKFVGGCLLRHEPRSRLYPRE